MKEIKTSTLDNIEGIVIKFGDDINTDLIMPSQYLDDPDPDYYSKFVMSGITKEFVETVERTSTNKGLPIILVAGKNFGSGSSREQAANGLKHIGIGAVLAESFNVIFFRNAINIGLPIAEIPKITALVKDDYHVVINLVKGRLKILKPYSTEINFTPLKPFLLERLEQGGLLPELKEFINSSNTSGE